MILAKEIILRIGLKNMRIVLLKSIPKDVRGVIVDIQLMTRLSSVNDNRVEFRLVSLLTSIEMQMNSLQLQVVPSNTADREENITAGDIE